MNYMLFLQLLADKGLQYIPTIINATISSLRAQHHIAVSHLTFLSLIFNLAVFDFAKDVGGRIGAELIAWDEIGVDRIALALRLLGLAMDPWKAIRLGLIFGDGRQQVVSGFPLDVDPSKLLTVWIYTENSTGVSDPWKKPGSRIDTFVGVCGCAIPHQMPPAFPREPGFGIYQKWVDSDSSSSEDSPGSGPADNFWDTHMTVSAEDEASETPVTDSEVASVSASSQENQQQASQGFRKQKQKQASKASPQTKQQQISPEENRLQASPQKTQQHDHCQDGITDSLEMDPQMELRACILAITAYTPSYALYAAAKAAICAAVDPEPMIVWRISWPEVQDLALLAVLRHLVPDNDGYSYYYAKHAAIRVACAARKLSFAVVKPRVVVIGGPEVIGGLEASDGRESGEVLESDGESLSSQVTIGLTNPEVSDGE